MDDTLLAAAHYQKAAARFGLRVSATVCLFLTSLQSLLQNDCFGLKNIAIVVCRSTIKVLQLKVAPNISGL